jgi:hypothetical protein
MGDHLSVSLGWPASEMGGAGVKENRGAGAG